MLKAEGIIKTYGALKVLKGVDVEVQDREVVAIVGPSGAGKSTLLHILGTLDTPDTGTVVLGSTDIFTLSANALAEFRNKNIGFVFQFHNLLPEFTALENVMIPALIGRQDDKKVKSRALELLTMLGLKDRVDHKPATLSGGEQQRAAVARALINAPSLLFADEPSGNLDSKNASELHQLFFKLRDELGCSCVIVTHNPEFANMADRKIEMQDGLVVA